MSSPFLCGFAADEIAASLAERLGPALPGGVRLAAAGPVVRITAGSTAVETDLARFAERGMLSVREAETATCAVLSAIQDAVSEALTVFWPVADALPDARVRAGALSAWFGAEEAPVLRLDDLATLS